MDTAGPGDGASNIGADRAIKILNLLLDSIQDDAAASVTLPVLNGEGVSLAMSFVRFTGDNYRLLVKLSNETEGHTRTEDLILYNEVLEAIFGKLMAIDWDRVNDDKISKVVQERRDKIWQAFSNLISSSSSRASYGAFYLSHLEGIIKFSCNPNFSSLVFVPIFELLGKEEAVTPERRNSVLQRIIHECNNLIEIHKAHPECRRNVSVKLRELYAFFLKSSHDDRVVLLEAGRRLRAYLYQNRIIGEIEAQEDRRNAFVYSVDNHEQMLAILEAEESSYVFAQDKAPDDAHGTDKTKFMEGYIVYNYLDEEKVLYITVKDTKFPDNFLGVGGLVIWMIGDVQFCKKLLMRDYTQPPYSFIKPIVLRAVIDWLAPLRTGAEDQLKHFVLGCSLREIHGIYRAIFEIAMPREQNAQQNWKNDRDFLIQLFNLNLRQRFIEAAETVGTSGQYDAHATIKIVDETSSVKDNSNATLFQTPKSPTTKDDANPAPQKEDEEKSSTLIWKALAFIIVVALIFLWIYSKRNPFKALGGSKSAPSSFVGSPLAP